MKKVRVLRKFGPVSSMVEVHDCFSQSSWGFALRGGLMMLLMLVVILAAILA